MKTAFILAAFCLVLTGNFMQSYMMVAISAALTLLMVYAEVLAIHKTIREKASVTQPASPVGESAGTAK